MVYQSGIERLADTDIKLVRSFLTRYPFPTYLHYPNLSQEGFASYLILVLKDSFLNDRDLTIIAKTGDEINGLASLIHLNWDSQHFGIPMAKIGLLLATGNYPFAFQTKRALLEYVLQECAKQAINFVSCRVNTEDSGTLHLLETEGFQLMDIITVMGKSLGTSANSPNKQPGLEYVTRTFAVGDLAILRNLGAELYATSRFYADPRLDKERVDALQNVWIENSTEHADTTLVIEREGHVGGFITCILEKQYTEATDTNLGFIGLLGVLPEMQGQGCGLRLVNAALDWFASQGVEIVTVGTQNINYGALGVYQKAEFRPIASLCTFHKWLA